MTGMWPIDNRSRDLQIDFHYVRRQVGRYLGFGFDSDVWDDEQAEAVQEIIDEGVRQFYFPPLVDGMIHEWTWMRPMFEITTEANARRYTLPEDWERPIGDLCYVDTSNDFYAPIKWTSATRLLKLEYQSNFTSYPQYAAYEPVETQGDGPQLQQLVLHPTPDSAYELKTQYQATARRLTAEHPYPLGGQTNGPLLLASCLSVAELQQQGSDGPMYQKFRERLSASIARDHQRGPKILGYNGNGHTSVRGRGMLRDLGGLYYNETLYGNTSYSG